MTATAVNGSGAIGIQIYGYAGGFDDPTSGLVHFGQRWYDPAAGRFTQQDALETLADPTRANRYEYANGNPINYVDPTGRDACAASLFGAGYGAVGIGFAIAGVLTAGSAGLFAAAVVGYHVSAVGLAAGLGGVFSSC